VEHLRKGTCGVIFPAEENHEKGIIIEGNEAKLMKATLAVSFVRIMEVVTEEHPTLCFFYTLTGPQNAYEEYSSCDKMRLVISFDGTTARTEDIRYSQKQYHDRTALMEIYDKEKSTLRYFTVHPNYLTTQQELQLAGFSCENEEIKELQMWVEFYEGEKLYGTMETITFYVGRENDALYLNGSDIYVRDGYCYWPDYGVK
jgi:hypothetical protein